MLTLTELYEPIAGDMKQVEAALESFLNSEWSFIEDLCEHLRRLRGKMLRPALLLLSGGACGELTDKHLSLAAVVEMIHMATLVHDDVLDEAEIRRKTQTINHMSGNERAVMLGDFVMSRSFRVCTDVGEPATRLLTQTAGTICEGELMQIHNRGNWDLTEEEYLTIIRMKTAALTAISCKLGAIYAGADEQTAANLSRYGSDVGVAFQIVDDVLDIAGDEASTGKTLGTDGKKGKLTLPTIHYLRISSAEDRKRYLELLSAGSEQRNALRELLASAASIEYAIDRARAYTDRAATFLEGLSPSPALESLQNMREFIIERHF